MRSSRKIFLAFLFTVTGYIACCQQPTFSLATNFTFLRSFKKQQQFWAAGQTITGHIHITPKNGVYAWLAYTTNGKFSNQLTATAKSPLTTPQEMIYNNRSQLKFQHVSLGWKHYLKGRSDSEDGWNLYGYAGLGLMMAQVTNTHSVAIDTADYQVPVSEGKAAFKRLTLDLGLGCEVPVGGDVFFYLEARALVPTTDYPSDHLYINKDAPLTGSANLGIRLLFQ